MNIYLCILFIDSGLMYRIYTEVKIITFSNHGSKYTLNIKALKKVRQLCIYLYRCGSVSCTLKCAYRLLSVESPCDQSRIIRKGPWVRG